MLASSIHRQNIMDSITDFKSGKVLHFGQMLYFYCLLNNMWSTHLPYKLLCFYINTSH